MKFLFCSLSSAGFVFPSVRIALELQARGHDIAFVTGQEFHSVLEQAGLRRITRGDKDGDSFQVPIWFEPMGVLLQFRHIEYALREFPADVLVASSLALGPLLMSEISHIPCGVLGTFPYLWPTTDEPPADPPTRDAERRWRHDDMLKSYNKLRELFKRPALGTGPTESPFLADLYMLRNIPELVPDFADMPARVHLVGDCLWEPPPDPELLAWLDQADAAGESILYVQQARTFNIEAFWPHLLAALKNRPVRMAASCSRMDVDYGETPDHSYVAPVVPQGAVMRRASGVVASGNTTVGLGILTHGQPSLLIPGGSEQRDVASLMSDARAAMCWSEKELSAESVGTALDQMLEDDAMRARCAELAERFAAFNGASRAADLLQELGETGAPVLR